MKLVYAFECVVDNRKFYVKLDNGAKDVVKLVYEGKHVLKRSSIVHVSSKKRYVVIGTKDISSNINNYPLVNEKYTCFNEGLWSRKYQKKYKEFMDHYGLKFNFLPMLKVSGYHLNQTQKHKFIFKIVNGTINLFKLQLGSLVKVYTKKGITDLIVTDIHSVNNPLGLDKLHNRRRVTYVSNRVYRRYSNKS